MPIRQLADAGAQSTVSGAITAVQTSVTLQSASGFPAILNQGQLSVTILDSGNPAFNTAAPLATPFEYQPVNAIASNVLTFGTGGGAASRAAYAGTTPKAYFAGATVAAGLLAEDIAASAPWKFDDQILGGGGAASVRIPASGSIPPSYLGVNWRSIEIIYETRDTSAGVVTDLMLLQINGDTTANYSDDFIRSLGGTVAGNQNLSSTFMRPGVVCNGGLATGIYANGRILIANAFDAGTKQKNCIGIAQAQTSTATAIYTIGGFWFNSTSAITFLTFSPSNGTFAGGTNFQTYLIP